MRPAMSMKKCRMAIVMAFAILVVGCARTPDVVLTLSVDSADVRVVEEVRRILLFRFGEFPVSFFSSIESEVDGAVISFRFKGGAPEESILTYLYQTPGRVNASIVESPGTLFTSRDIEDAALMHDDAGRMLLLRLTASAGERMRVLTARNVGKTVRLAMDGRVLIEATISGVLSDSFQVVSPEQDRERGLALITVLRSGPLPALVSAEPAKKAGLWQPVQRQRDCRRDRHAQAISFSTWAASLDRKIPDAIKISNVD